MRSLEITFLVGIILLVILLGTSFAVVNISSNLRSIRQEMEEEGELLVETLAAASLGGLVRSDPDEIEEILRRAKRNPILGSVEVIDDRGMVLGHTDPSRRARPASISGDEIMTLKVLTSRAVPGGVEFTRIVERGGQRWGAVRLVLSTGHTRSKLFSYVRKTIVVSVLFIILGIWVSVVLARRITVPTRQLIAATESIRQGRFDVDLTPDAPIELATLMTRFRSMAETLKANRDALDRRNAELFELTKSLERRVEDATERLREVLSYTDAIVGSSSEAILTTDAGGRIVVFNPAAERILGRKCEDAKGTDVQRWFAQDPGFSRALAQVLAGGESPSIEVRTEKEPGESRALLVTLSPLRLEPYGVLGAVVIANDISERKRYESEMQRTERMSSLGQLASGVAHEINNVLAVVLGYAAVLRREGGLQGQLGEDVRHLEKEVVRGQKIVRDMLSYARPGPLHLEPADIRAVLDEAWSLASHAAKKKDVALAREYPPDLPAVHIDTARMTQVFVDVMLNAIDAVGEEGAITLRVRPPADGTIEVEIHDTGRGIAREHLDKVFDPFFTTKPPGQGTGLGLSVCQGIVSRHGGTIAISSEPGRGTTVEIRLPLGPGAEEADRRPAPRAGTGADAAPPGA